MPPRIQHIFEDGIEKKRCSKCKQYLELDNFIYKLDRWDKKHNECNKCRLIRNKKRFDPDYEIPDDMTTEEINIIYGKNNKGENELDETE